MTTYVVFIHCAHVAEQGLTMLVHKDTAVLQCTPYRPMHRKSPDSSSCTWCSDRPRRLARGEGRHQLDRGGAGHPRQRGVGQRSPADCGECTHPSAPNGRGRLRRVSRGIQHRVAAPCLPGSIASVKCVHELMLKVRHSCIAALQTAAAVFNDVQKWKWHPFRLWLS